MKNCLTKKKFRFKLIYKTFKKFKTVFFNRKVYKHLHINYINTRSPSTKVMLNKNTDFTNLYFPYTFFFNKNYKTEFISIQKFSYFYGSSNLKFLKKKIKLLDKNLKVYKISNILHKNVIFLKMFENRIDSILYRTFFVLNFKQAKQLVFQKYVRINNLQIVNPFFVVTQGDVITFSKNCHAILNKNILNSLKFEFIPSNIEINFKTFQIICITPLNNFIPINKNFNLLDSFKLDYSINSIFRFFKKL